LKEQIILGVDPGTSVTGFGLIKVEGKKLSLIHLGVIQTGKLDDHPLKLKKIFEGVLSIIEQYHPDMMAIEAPFFGKNVQSMLKLGRAQGVAMAAAMYRDIPLCEYSPKKIKQSITGNGNASKEQVSSMLQNLLKFDGHPEFLDATDGLAAAVCHHLQNNLTIPISKKPATKKSTKKHTGWASYLSDNPSKIIKK
jgi:crossover junction endodeoxyribonuclease RuvC